MQILFYSEDEDVTPWENGLHAALPQAQLRVWQPGDRQPADYALVWRPPQEMLQQRAGLKAIFNLGAGVDGILRHRHVLPAGVPLIRLDDAGMAIQMAEYACHCVLRYFRRFDEYEMQARAGQWRELEPHARNDFTVGILGLGVLGKRIAQMLQPFGFRLKGWSRTLKQLPGIECYAGAEGLDALLQGSRVLISVLPLTEETNGLLNRNTLGKLPRGAYLINIARGAQLVEPDLLALLDSGQLSAATLDVFCEEPLPSEHPFWRHPRITITPHIAALTLRDETIAQIADKIAALERGETVAGMVDLNKGY